MKSSHALIRLALFVLCLCAGAAVSAQPQFPADAEKIPPERFEAKVLKVFAAKDGKAVFRAYLVKWKDQEVIVSDPLAKSDYMEGDTISVLAMNHPFPQGKESHRLLAFTVVPQRR
jgi:hypothetical protein